MDTYQLITVLGPTASGKTTFAAALAARLNTEIISADSRQIYRSMDIGTGKDLADYTVNGKTIPYHLIDICDPGYKYNVFEYQHDFFRAYETIRKKGKLPILCGGTGMYIEAVLKGYRLLDVPQNPGLRESLKDKSLPELEQILAGYKVLHNKTDVDTAQRAIRAIEIEEYYKNEAPDVNEYDPINSLIIGIDIDRELRREKISRRLRVRLDEGKVDFRLLCTGKFNLRFFGNVYGSHSAMRVPRVICWPSSTVISGGILSNKKGVNIPGVPLPIDALTEKMGYRLPEPVKVKRKILDCGDVYKVSATVTKSCSVAAPTF